MNATTARAFLALVGVIALAVGGIQYTGYGVAANSTAGLGFFAIGVIGIVLTAVFGTSDQGLTNTQQAYLSGLSVALISIGGISLNPAVGLPAAYSLVFAVLGVIGFAIKEAAGGAAPVAVPAPAAKS